MKSVLTFALLAAVTVPAVRAQNPAPTPPPPGESRERTYTFRFGPGSEDHMTLMHRGRLGVTVDMRADAGRDTIGALIAGVLPGGAADRAGVHAGDVVTRVNGTRLAAATATGDDGDSDASRPAMRLIRIASRLDPGDTVMLEVKRDGRTQTITFQAEESDMDALTNHMEPMMRGMGEGLSRIPELMQELPMRIGVAFSGTLSDIELVKVNPDLGQYFGTTEGLLVTTVGGDSALGLKAGDVILAIGGRKPTSPSHAMRILSTYDPGEAVQIDVMRQRRRISVAGHMPQPREAGWRVRHNSFDIPVMPRMPFFEEGSPHIMIKTAGPTTIET